MRWRFEKRVFVGLPDYDARRQMLASKFSEDPSELTDDLSRGGERRGLFEEDSEGVRPETSYARLHGRVIYARWFCAFAI